MKDTPKPGKPRKYAAAFRTEALRLAGQSRSTPAHPSQPRLGVRYYVPALGHWHGGGHDAGRIGCHGLAASLFRPAAHRGPSCSLRPGSYPVGRAILRQRVPRLAARPRGRALTEPLRRVRRQRPAGYDPDRKPLVPPRLTHNGPTTAPVPAAASRSNTPSAAPSAWAESPELTAISP